MTGHSSRSFIGGLAMPDSAQEAVYLPLLVRFAIFMAIFLLIPPLCRRMRVPPVVGLLLAGVALGPSGLHALTKAGSVVTVFGEIGKLLLMFFAGLEIDLSQFRRTARRSLAFGFLTFAIPQIVGTGVGLIAGYGWLPAVLIGSLMASHTLLGFPIVQRMKLVTDEAVAVTIGGTIFTDLTSLLVLAICLPIHTAGFSTGGFVLQIVEMVAFILFAVAGLGSLGHWLLERMGNAKDKQVTLILLMIAGAGIAAEAINLEPIIGAFLAGLAVNRALHHRGAREELEFLGHTLFIPMFFVSIGFLIDVRVFLQTLVGRPGMVAGIVGGLIGSKYLAAKLTQRLYGYSRAQGGLIWSLSLPQVAATLATAIVAYDTKNAAGVRLIDEPVINTVLVLVVVTSVLGPVLTEYFGRRRLEEPEAIVSAVLVTQTATHAVVDATETHRAIEVTVTHTELGVRTDAPTE
jgi:Kef-type K+ transport system membrane component KefB